MECKSQYVVELTRGVLEKMNRHVCALQASVKSGDVSRKLKALSGAVVDDGLLSIPATSLFGEAWPSECATTFTVRIKPALLLSDDADMGGDAASKGQDDDGDEAADRAPASNGSAQSKGAALSVAAEARGVMQGSAVTEVLISKLGTSIDQVNKVLNARLLQANVSVKRRKEPHPMPAIEDTRGEARRKLSKVAQQVVGAAWTLNARQLPTDSTERLARLNALKADLKEDAGGCSLQG